MPTAAPGPSDALASVISLDASRRTHPPAEAAPAPGAPSAPDHAELARALAALRRHVGERGLELPADLGRRLAHIERLLAETPTALDTGRVLPALAAEVGALAAAAGRVTLDLVPEEAEVLSAALGAPLDGLPLGALHEVADAVLAVSRAPQAAARWGDPRAAQAAEAVLTVAAGDLREAARTHEWLYAHFTDLVWEVPPQLLERASSRWRVAARGRLRRILRVASRTGRLPGGVAAAAEGVSAARAARARVAAVAPLLSQHLGSVHRGPLSNADEALHAIRAVRRLQGALGDRVDPERLSHLLRADAFRSEDVFGPAVNIRIALRAWQRDIEGLGGSGPWDLTIDELEAWVDGCLELLPVLRHALHAVTEIGARDGSLGALVDVHLLREHIAELVAVQERTAEQEVVSS